MLCERISRLLALAAVLDGMARDDAARIGGMDRQTLRGWVHRFNRLGADGLIDIKPSGRRRKFSAEHDAELKRLVEAGSGPESAVARWRCVDLKRVLSRRFDVDLSEAGMGRALKLLGFFHISARPQHPAQDPEKIAALKKTSPAWLTRHKRARAGDSNRSVVPEPAPYSIRG